MFGCLLVLAVMLAGTLLFLSIASVSQAKQLNGPEESESILLLGRIITKYDGFAGAHFKRSSPCTIVFEWNSDSVPEKYQEPDESVKRNTALEQIKKNTAITDASGYFALGNLSVGCYKVKKVILEEGAITNASLPLIIPSGVSDVSGVSRIIVFGTLTFEFKEDGTVDSGLSCNGYLQGKVGGRCTITLDDCDPSFDYSHYLTNADFARWHPIIREEMERAKAAPDNKKRQESENGDSVLRSLFAWE